MCGTGRAFAIPVVRALSEHTCTCTCPCSMRGHGHMHVLRALAVEEGALSFMGVSTLDAHSLPLC
jgi:hypothetical protein